MQKAVDLIREQKDNGQIRRFTGNDYADDHLASGNVAIAQAYSGDVVQLQADNPDLEFIVPESGGTTFIDTMVIPYTTKNQPAAEAWINYIYDRANYAKLVAFTQFVPVLSDMTEELRKVDPAAADNPLINPPQSTLDKVKSWPALTRSSTRCTQQSPAADRWQVSPAAVGSGARSLRILWCCPRSSISESSSSYRFSPWRGHRCRRRVGRCICRR